MSLAGVGRKPVSLDQTDLILERQQSIAFVPQNGLPRFWEVLLAIVGFTLCAPLLLLAGVLIAVTSKGPILFRQHRVGLNGRLFTLYKLRTMRASTDGPQVTASGDARVTLVGKFLRKTKLDELPELWNVIKGDMSLVGPRPEVDRYVDRSNPSWKLLLQTKPGVSDPVTLQLRNEEALLAAVESNRERFYVEVLQPFKLKGYLEYLKGRSWRSDLHVLYRTAIAVALPNTAPLPIVEDITPLPDTRPWLND